MKLLYRAGVVLALCLLGYATNYIRYSLFTGSVPPAEPLVKAEKEPRARPVEHHVATSPAPTTTTRPPAELVLAVVVCGDRIQETLVMIKSAIFFTFNVKLRVVVVAEAELILSFNEKLSEWRKIMNNSFEYETHHVSFPDNGSDNWKRLFKPCASQRLFFPSLLSHLSQVLYVDTDTLFLTSVETIWDHLSKMNSTQFAALAPEHEDPNTGWYNRFAKHPYYGKLGVNSGVMLMNLTRMREFQWEKYLHQIYKAYKLKLTYGDQDIINIIFHFHPERLYVYDCSYNFRSDHCMYMSVCKPAELHGVKVLHGSRGTFHSEKQPAFKAVYTAMDEYQLGSEPHQYLYLPMETYLQDTTGTNCGKNLNMYLNGLRSYIDQLPGF